MKITNDELDALRQQELTRSNTSSEAGNFQEVLAQEIGGDSTSASVEGLGAPPPGAKTLGIGSMLQVENLSETQETMPTEREVMDNIDSLLSKWENYAQTLQTQDQDEGLRQAYGVLENIEQDIEGLKETVPNLAQENSDLQNMVDELEIMAVTEKIKFNRGDYIA